jgi:hypothetical protein
MVPQSSGDLPLSRLCVTIGAQPSFGTMEHHYSERERALFKALGFDHNLEMFNPPSLYKMIAVKCFADNSQGPEVDSLRRCVSAIENCSPYRMTFEFDSLINL